MKLDALVDFAFRELWVKQMKFKLILVMVGLCTQIEISACHKVLTQTFKTFSQEWVFLVNLNVMI